jgi:hypothetical protein
MDVVKVNSFMHVSLNIKGNETTKVPNFLSYDSSWGYSYQVILGMPV